MLLYRLHFRARYCLGITRHAYTTCSPKLFRDRCSEGLKCCDGVLQPPRKNGGPTTAWDGQKPSATAQTNGGGFARVASMVAAGKRLAKTASSSKHSQPTRSFCFNDNGSMVDLQCEDRGSTFQRRGGTLPEDQGLVVLRGPEVDAERRSRFQWRRQNEVECWSSFSGDLGTSRLPTAEELLAPVDADRNSFRMWSPTPPHRHQRESNYPLSDYEYETTLLRR